MTITILSWGTARKRMMNYLNFKNFYHGSLKNSAALCHVYVWPRRYVPSQEISYLLLLLPTLLPFWCLPRQAVDLVGNVDSFVLRPVLFNQFWSYVHFCHR